MPSPASRSRFDVARDTRFSIFATAFASEAVPLPCRMGTLARPAFCLQAGRARVPIRHLGPLRRAWWSAVVLVVIGLRPGLAAESDNVLLDFTATWCGPCQQMSAAVSKLERQGLPIRKVDIDQEPALASRFNVQSIPCFVLVSNGKELDRVTGLTTEKQLLGMLNRLPKPPKEVAQSNEAPRRGNGTGSGGLGLPIDLGQIGQLDGKRPPLGLPFGNKNKAKDTRVAEVPFDDQTVPRGQSPDNVAVDPLLASVRLRVQDGTGINFGSGTIIDSKPGRTVILTCGHIFRKGGNDSKVEVDLFFGPNAKSRPETVPGKVLHFDLEADVGVVTIVHAQQLPVVRLGSSRELVVKDRVLSIGCGGGDKPTREDLTLTALNRYAGPDNIECTGMPQQGRSGGGLFLGSEQIGVCIAAEPREKRGIYAGLKPIALLLDKVGLGHLAPVPPAAEAALAATNAVGTKTAGLGEPAMPERSSATAADEIGRFFESELGAAALAGPAAAPQDYEGAEIVCIVRSKKPGVPSRVVIVNQASGRFVGDLLHESQGPAERVTSQRDTPVRQTNQRPMTDAAIVENKTRSTAPGTSRPIETSFEPQPYRRQRDK